MERAAIIIGVSRAGRLPKLQAVNQGVRAMADWAEGQGFASVDVILDDTRRVGVAQVEDAIASVVERSTVEQLVVYFSGHGQNNGLTEYWLLSEAPARSSAAINVDGSARQARYCGIPHVVLISDACRTAADGVIAQAVQGTVVFPNDPVPGPGRPVDEFYACSLGSPALEVRDARDAAAAYQAVYTDCLVGALTGILAPGEAGPLEKIEGGVHVVRPWPLRTYLETAVARRLTRLQPGRTLAQTPDAQINSPASAWLSRIEARVERRVPDGPPRLAPPETVGTRARAVLEDALGKRPAERRRTAVPSAADLALAEALDRQMLPFDLAPSEIHCGVTLRGADIATVWGAGAEVQQLSLNTVSAVPAGSAGNVAVSLDDGSGVIMPVIAGFLTRLTVEGNELVEVSFEPSVPSPERAEYEARRDDLEELRALIMVATRHGTFRLDGVSAQSLGKRLQYAKSIDPAMAVHAAYAYDSMQRPDLVKDMQDRLSYGVGIRLFDVALLAREFVGSAVFPPVPMLARGWALLEAYGYPLTPSLRDLRRRLLPSVWTVFNAEGMRVLRDTLEENQ